LDSCTIILLAKSTVLEKLTENFTIIITKEVYEEIMKGKEKMFEDALLVERLNDQHKIIRKNCKNEIRKKLEQDFNMGAGESSTIALGIENQKYIIGTDNKQGRKASRINNLNLVGSIEIVVSLFKKKSITKDKAYNSLKLLKDEGWFNDYLIEKAMEDLI